MKKRLLSLSTILTIAPISALVVSCGNDEGVSSSYLNQKFDALLPVMPLPSPKLKSFELDQIPASGKLTQNLLNQLGILFPLPEQALLGDTEFLYKLTPIQNDINNLRAAFEFVIQLASTTDLQALSSTVRKTNIYSIDDKPTYTVRALTRADITMNNSKYIVEETSTNPLTLQTTTRRTINWDAMRQDRLNAIGENAFAIIPNPSNPEDLDLTRRLTHLEVPDFIVEIRNSAFENNSLQSVDMSGARSLISIGSKAFKNNNINDLILKQDKYEEPAAPEPEEPETLNTLTQTQSGHIDVGDYCFEGNALESAPEFGSYDNLYKPFWNKFKGNYFSAKIRADEFVNHLANFVENNVFSLQFTTAEFDSILNAWGNPPYRQTNLTLAQLENALKFTLPQKDVLGDLIRDVTFNVEISLVGPEDNNGVRDYSMKLTVNAGKDMQGSTLIYSKEVPQPVILRSLPSNANHRAVIKEIDFINKFSTSEVWMETNIKQMREMLNWSTDSFTKRYTNFNELSRAIPINNLFKNLNVMGHAEKPGAEVTLTRIGDSRIGFAETYELKFKLVSASKEQDVDGEDIGFYEVESKPVYIYGFKENKHEHIYNAVTSYIIDTGFGKYSHSTMNELKNAIGDGKVVKSKNDYRNLVWKNLRIIDVDSPKMIDTYQEAIELLFTESFEDNNQLHTTFKYEDEEVFDFALSVNPFSSAFNGDYSKPILDIDNISQTLKQYLEKQYFSPAALPKRFYVDPVTQKAEVNISTIIARTYNTNLFDNTGVYTYKAYYLNPTGIHNKMDPMTLEIQPFYKGKLVPNKSIEITLKSPYN